MNRLLSFIFMVSCGQEPPTTGYGVDSVMELDRTASTIVSDSCTTPIVGFPADAAQASTSGWDGVAASQLAIVSLNELQGPLTATIGLERSAGGRTSTPDEYRPGPHDLPKYWDEQLSTTVVGVAFESAQTMHITFDVRLAGCDGETASFLCDEFGLDAPCSTRWRTTWDAR